MKKIVILEQKLLDYRIPVYEEISKYVKEEIVINYWDNYNSEHHRTIKPNKISVKKHKIINIANKLYIPIYSYSHLFKNTSTIVIRANVRNLMLIPILILSKVFNIKTILWGQGFSKNRKFNPFKNTYDFIHLICMYICNSYVFYDENTKNNASKYINDEKLFVANNTIDTNKEEYYKSKLNKIGKYKIKEKLGLCKPYYICFIGRLNERKRLLYLIEVYKELIKEYPNIGLCIIGNGEMKSYIKNKIEQYGMKDVVLLEEKYDYDAAKYLYVCDILTIPGSLGLSVNHGMIYDMPVISQKDYNNNIGHGPEYNYIINNYNGALSEYNSIKSFKNNIINILNNIDKYKENVAFYSKNNLTIDRMVEGFVKCYEYTIQKR